MPYTMYTELRKGNDTMHIDNMKDILKDLNTEDLTALINLASQERRQKEEAKEAKYMDAINKAIQAYLDNVGDLTFHVEYEDADGQDAETDIIVDSTNPPAGGQGTIYI